MSCNCYSFQFFVSRWAAVFCQLVGRLIEHSDPFSFLQNSQIHMDSNLYLRIIQKLHRIGCLSLAQPVIILILICKMICIGMMRKKKATS